MVRLAPSYSDDFVTLYTGTALDVLSQMPSQSVHMAVTSPPYFGLRSYLPKEHFAKGQELGTEKTPDEYVAKLVEVIAEVWRVLRDDGTLWVNIGDSYAANRTYQVSDQKHTAHDFADSNAMRVPPGLKPKDLCMIPARLAIALCDFGWYLRQELVWAKDSAMPESVRDRCTRSHEYIYMLTKKPRYFYDSEAIKERGSQTSHGGNAANNHKYEWKPTIGGEEQTGLGRTVAQNGASGRNARSVWRINPKPFGGAHFAVFPPELPMRCIKAGTSEKGVCSLCGAPWKRAVEVERVWTEKDVGQTNKDAHLASQSMARSGNSQAGNVEGHTVGWEPTCSHDADVIPATVLDCFAGSGTTLYAARRLGRQSVGIDLDEKSAELLQDRLGYQGVLL